MKLPTNRKRADWASMALTTFAQEVGETDMLDEEMELVISDLLADMMHLCDVEQIDWDRCVARAQDHFREEQAEERGMIHSTELH